MTPQPPDAHLFEERHYRPTDDDALDREIALDDREDDLVRAAEGHWKRCFEFADKLMELVHDGIDDSEIEPLVDLLRPDGKAVNKAYTAATRFRTAMRGLDQFRKDNRT